MTTQIDPFTVEVIRNALTAVAEEMSLVIMRSARSPLLREAGDLSSALTDASGGLIAQGRDIPAHLGIMGATVQAFLGRVPAGQLQPGDVWFLNLPEVGGNHLPDVKAIRPVFSGTTLQAFAVCLAHWADIGGANPGSYVPDARDAWQEGLRIPPLRVFTRHGVDREKLDVILSNVRGAEEREGDILAQMAATRAADGRLQELFARFGVATLQAAIEDIHNQAEAEMRNAIRELPDGEYSGEDFLDNDGITDRKIAVRVKITIREDTAVFDFRDSDDSATGPLNATPYTAAASVFYAMKAIAGPDIQPSAGAARPVQIETRPGSILNPPVSSPVVGGNHETSQRVVDAIFKAMEAAVPERLSAGGSTTSGLLLFSGIDPRTGKWTTLYEVHGGGEGARCDRDGYPTTRPHMSNVMNTPAEVIEKAYPIRVERQALRSGSGGRGKHAGGDGQERRYRILAPRMVMTSMVERCVVPPYGLQQGEPGAPFRISVERTDGSCMQIAGKTHIELFEGDCVIMQSSGGGGYGLP
ncbi:MAG: methylhydantoinase [Acidiferrobacteraceae bacterium]|jgi:N-methylhydantoinase B|nr:methylhydantoinase [Acidiferrobacteraceae bacterium]MDP6398799.1 hydantoinase B/oxoprolinase family protein [Arenicellales bacterium]MDP6551189.1 hydantoinase B/oxoprolinase family protein [Arenicellales bacterium]MDP6918989.1 hydantoinase B/oxoprolinase family protein [Arenicellales bacterium]|tara:strand:- start:532 stop:2115 length:1584 start_codon:yes stop_codon:yes gene_type:complete